MKPKLKLPGSKQLKLKCNVLLSNRAFEFYLRRYSMGAGARMSQGASARMSQGSTGVGQGLTLVHVRA